MSQRDECGAIFRNRALGEGEFVCWLDAKHDGPHRTYSEVYPESDETTGLEDDT